MRSQPIKMLFSQFQRVLANRGMVVRQSLPDEVGTKRSQAFENPHRMQASCWPNRFSRKVLQRFAYGAILPLDQQSMGRAPMPAVRVRQEFDKFGAGSGAERCPQRSPSLRRFRHDAVDATQRVASAKVHVQPALDRVGNEIRVLEVLAVVVDHVEVPVGRVREVDRSEPVVGGGEELRVGRPAARRVGRSLRQDEIAVD